MIKRLRVRIPAGVEGEFSSPWSTFVCKLLFGVHCTPDLLQWHVKDSGHSAKSAGGRLHPNTYSLDLTKLEWADYAAVQAEWEPIWK